MKFTPAPIGGVWVIDPERIEDERGFFARSWCESEFRERGLNPRLAQCNLSFNARRGTLRGLHYQAAPHAEAKLIRCTMGAIFDVAVDLATGKWFAVELSAAKLTKLNTTNSRLRIVMSRKMIAFRISSAVANTSAISITTR